MRSTTLCWNPHARLRSPARSATHDKNALRTNCLCARHATLYGRSIRREDRTPDLPPQLTRTVHPLSRRRAVLACLECPRRPHHKMRPVAFARSPRGARRPVLLHPFTVLSHTTSRTSAVSFIRPALSRHARISACPRTLPRTHPRLPQDSVASLAATARKPPPSRLSRLS